MMTRPIPVDLAEAKKAIAAVVAANPDTSYSQVWERTWRATHDPEFDPIEPTCENWHQEWTQDGDPQPRIPMCLVGQALNYWGVIDEIDETHQGEAFEDGWWEGVLSVDDEARLYLRAVQERQDTHQDDTWAECVEYVENNWDEVLERSEQGVL